MIFIENKYTKWYNTIIISSKSRILPTNLYVEKHHIIPKSMGGSDSKENIAILTAREHFVCHLLLTKMTIGNNNYKMKFALSMLANTKNIGEGRYTPSSRIYEYSKKSFKESMISYWTDENRKIHAEKISKVVKGRKLSDETKEKHRNKIWSEKALQNLKDIAIISANNRKGKPWSEKMRNTQIDMYLRSNIDNALLIFDLVDAGEKNISVISRKIGISWDRIRLILERRTLFIEYSNDK